MDEDTDFIASGNDTFPTDMYNCSVYQYDWPEFKFVAVIRTFTAVISLICAICVIFVIAAYKKFKYFPQRLILYLAVAVVVHSIAYSLGRISYHEERELLDPHCRYFGGFFELYTAWSELFAIFCITGNIFVQIIFGVDSSRLEFLYVLLITAAPLAWCWIPYMFNSFGIQGPWCGIRIHTVDCTFYDTGLFLRFGLWEIPIFTIFLFTILTSIVTIGCKLKLHLKEWEGHRYDPKRQEAKQKIVKNIRPLLFYPLIYFLLKTPLLGEDIYQSFHPKLDVQMIRSSLTIWIIEAICSPLAGAVVVLAYAFDSETRRRLKQRSIKDICMACFQACKCGNKQDPVDYNIDLNTMFGDSLEGEAARQAVYTKHMMRTDSLMARNNAFDIL